MAAAHQSIGLAARRLTVRENHSIVALHCGRDETPRRPPIDVLIARSCHDRIECKRPDAHPIDREVDLPHRRIRNPRLLLVARLDAHADEHRVVARRRLLDWQRVTVVERRGDGHGAVRQDETDA